MIVTIDGPAGAGKSTVARSLADWLTAKLGKTFEYLDTGSMYRAVALLGVRGGVDWQIAEQLARLARCAIVNIIDGRTFLDGEDVTEAVRSPVITEHTRYAADHPVIRGIMVEQQQNIAQTFLAKNKGLVTEGRDQGTVVFPDAACKFFLTATPEERTKRRLGELLQRGVVGNFDEIYQQIMDRDTRDSARLVGPLSEPPDAHRIISDGLTIDEVVERMAKICCSAG